jgi:hypothetical protein
MGKLMMMLAMILITMSCAPNIALVEQYQKDDAAILKFYGDAGGNDLHVVVDNEVVGIILYGEESEIKVSPGEHVIQVFSSAAGNPSIPFKKNFVSNTVYYFDTHSTRRILTYGSFLSEISAAEFKKLKEGNKKLEGR